MRFSKVRVARLLALKKPKTDLTISLPLQQCRAGTSSSRSAVLDHLPSAHDGNHRPLDPRRRLSRLPSRVRQDGTLGDLSGESSPSALNLTGLESGEIAHPRNTFLQMDVGVGSFVFSLGLISARPFLAPPDSTTSKRQLWPSLLKSIKSSIPTILLGLIRVAMVKGVEYPVRSRDQASTAKVLLH